MRLLIHLLCCLIMSSLVGCVHASQSMKPIASQGETLVAVAAGKLNVQVKIKTYEVKIGQPSSGRPSVTQSSCTYSKYPCSIVERIEIIVNGIPLFIPRSVFCDLADLTNAEVKTGEMGTCLILYGGDASESYVVRIDFDSDKVKRRVLSNAIHPDKALQETIYSTQVLGD